MFSGTDTSYYIIRCASIIGLCDQHLGGSQKSVVVVIQIKTYLQSFLPQTVDEYFGLLATLFSSFPCTVWLLRAHRSIRPQPKLPHCQKQVANAIPFNYTFRRY